jgi:hypothetical protein
VTGRVLPGATASRARLDVDFITRFLLMVDEPREQHQGSGP